VYNDNYKLPAGAVVHNQSILVLGNAKIYMPSDGKWDFADADVTKIPKGSSLEIYDAANNDAGFAGVTNDSGLAANFTYYGLSTADKKLSLSGSGQFAGGIYAPYKNVVLTGSSSSLPRDFIGALVAKTVKNSGHFYMSYDQALGYTATGNPTLVSYQEL
jgi:hypothetical protein